MNEHTIVDATGRKPSEWYGLIEDAGLSGASHKKIAEYLNGFPEISFWWAQTLTVEYEKHTGRRITGQTAGGNFQIGVSRTLKIPVTDLWAFLESPDGISMLLTEGAPDGPMSLHTDGLESFQADSPDGIEAETTTYHHASHVRMRFRLPGWEQHSILQIRVQEKDPERTVLTFHQEKLPDQAAREAMKTRWKDISARIADRLES